MPRRTARRPADGEPTKSERTRERILTAAAEVLARQGYAGTRLSDVAEVAQVRAPAIYYYWPSREELLEEVVTVGQRATHDAVVAALAALPPEAGNAMDRVDRAVAAHLEVVLTRSDFSSAAIRNLGQLPPDIRRRQLVGQRAYGDLWRDLLDEARAAGVLAPALDVRAARMLVLGALNWAPEWWNPERSSLASVVATAQLLVRGGLSGSHPEFPTLH